MRGFIVALVESALTAVYWWLVVTISYGLFGGSRDPAAPPPDQVALMIQTIGPIAAGIIGYALLSLWWRKAIRPRLG